MRNKEGHEGSERSFVWRSLPDGEEVLPARKIEPPPAQNDLAYSVGAGIIAGACGAVGIWGAVAFCQTFGPEIDKFIRQYLF